MSRLIAGLSVAFAVAACVASATPVTVAAAGGCGVVMALHPPPPNRPHYLLHIKVEPGLRRVDGTLTVSFTPPRKIDRLIFRLWPNSAFYARRGAKLTVSSVTSQGHHLPTSTPDATMLVVERPVASHLRITVSMNWALRLPRQEGLQLHGGSSARLLSFFPLLAWKGAGWSTDRPVRTDSFWPTSPTADFDARIAVPARLRVLATGEEVGPGRWHARAVRDFAVAVGSFQVVSTTVNAPRPVRIMVGLERGSPYSAHDFLVSAAHVLRFYAARYADYPWSTYSLAVMKDFIGLSGTAYPTLGFLGDASLVLVPTRRRTSGSTRSSATISRTTHGSAKDLRPGRRRAPSTRSRRCSRRQSRRQSRTESASP
jgi:hypothetical protein